MTDRHSISVIFPAYNEEQALENTINRARTALEKVVDNFEIIIVDDASTDNTGKLADKLAADDPHIRVLHNQTNLRQGASLLKGFTAARHALVTHNAIDYPFDMEDLAIMLPLLSKSDIVVASCKERPGYSLYRKFLSQANLFLLQLLFDLKLRDYNFIQIYKREVIESIKVSARSTGFVTPELLIRANKHGYRITEVEIKYLPRLSGEAKSGSVKVISSTLKDLFSFWWSFQIWHRQ